MTLTFTRVYHKDVTVALIVSIIPAIYSFFEKQFLAISYAIIKMFSKERLLVDNAIRRYTAEGLQVQAYVVAALNNLQSSENVEKRDEEVQRV